MLARQIRRLRPGLVLLQHPDDLIFREPRSLHLSVLQEARTLNPRGGKSQRQVNRYQKETASITMHDVHNVQQLARRLLLQRTGLWRYWERTSSASDGRAREPQT